VLGYFRRNDRNRFEEDVFGLDVTATGESASAR
jgi:hypothetical protein